MNWKRFTPEEIVSLRNNQYTLKVTERTITFTLQFKKEMLAGLQKGKSAKIIMKELGYDPDVLGESRISGLAYHLIKEAESPEGLHEGRHKPKVVKPVTEDELAAYPPLFYKKQSPPC